MLPRLSCTFWVWLPSDFAVTSTELFIFKMGTTRTADSSSNPADRASAVIIKNPTASPYFSMVQGDDSN